MIRAAELRDRRAKQNKYSTVEQIGVEDVRKLLDFVTES